ncbi:hypothetical protein [Amycolatopsis suaedae]|uniref:Uncharacterized protein n=1 Tax=Amycolatopsis suaedae TaxID=2510978 RepID=A0A4Q7JDS1_9PSEU|nr:hypothetical protein [Amycolatopsis suaedae]RZQ65348.1 hypothetical protein EWH70_05585 [Amycolatopsis suaedae]
MEVLLKALLAPVLVLLVSLAQRRWGDRLGGRLTALPLTSGPFVLVLALTDGADAGREAVHGVLLGMPAIVVFCAGYTALAPRLPGWAALAIAVSATAATCAATALLAPPLWLSLTAVAAAVLYRKRPAPTAAESPPGWELPCRVTTSALLVLVLGLVSTVVSPGVAGVLATFPVLACVMTAGTRLSGRRAASVELTRGLLAGTPPTAALFVVTLAAMTI